MVKAVVDATAGSGQLARACLEIGVPYTGVAKNQTHAHTLNKLLDRRALSLVGQKGSACHDADLAVLVEKHLFDVTEVTNQQDLVGDSEAKDDESSD